MKIICEARFNNERKCYEIAEFFLHPYKKYLDSFKRQGWKVGQWVVLNSRVGRIYSIGNAVKDTNLAAILPTSQYSTLRVAWYTIGTTQTNDNNANDEEQMLSTCYMLDSNQSPFAVSPWNVQPAQHQPHTFVNIVGDDSHQDNASIVDENDGHFNTYAIRAVLNSIYKHVVAHLYIPSSSSSSTIPSSNLLSSSIIDAVLRRFRDDFIILVCKVADDTLLHWSEVDEALHMILQRLIRDSNGDSLCLVVNNLINRLISHIGVIRVDDFGIIQIQRQPHNSNNDDNPFWTATEYNALTDLFPAVTKGTGKEKKKK